MQNLGHALAVAALVSGASVAPAAELITNGGFETGDYTGWAANVEAGSSGALNVATGTVSPISGFATAGPSSGTFYSVTDQSGPGAYALTQTFFVPVGATSVWLKFDMFANDQNGAGAIINPIGLDYTDGPNQHARVDLLTAAAGAFDTGAGVLANFYLGVDSPVLPNPYTSYSFDLTGLVTPGTAYQIRFAEVDNQFYFQQGVDNVSIAATIPEPATLALLIGGLALVSAAARRRG